MGTSRTTGHLRTAGAVVTGTATLVLTVATASPSVAHGSLERPASRTSACGTEGSEAGSAACRAALEASGRDSMPDWDNLRVADVDGRDRDVIPDGELCSAGLPEFAGLDLPRRDWPATTVRAGSAFRFTYRATIPHQGDFRLYVTKNGYDPEEPLTWADLEPDPFLTVRDPAVRSGAYTWKGKLPQGKAGRHVIYTVWQNTDTPDTYYSCSDVVFRKARKASAAGTPTPTPSVTADATPAPSVTATPTQDPTAIAAATTSAEATPESPPWVQSVAGLIGIALVAGGAVWLRRREKRD